MENKMEFVKATNINVSVKKTCKHGKIRISDQNIGYKMLYKMGWDGINQLGKKKGYFKDPITMSYRDRKKRFYRFGLCY
jgi:hypothetical protein